MYFQPLRLTVKRSLVLDKTPTDKQIYKKKHSHSHCVESFQEKSLNLKKKLVHNKSSPSI